MSSKATIVKIGGNVLDDAVKLTQVLSAFNLINHAKILVHGGGKKASEISRQLGKTPQMIDGRRITDSATMEIVQMVYAGLINKNIVAELQSIECDAIGLSGADANCIIAKKRPVKEINFGFAGDIESVRATFLKELLSLTISPVICPITYDGKNQLLNTNADTIAAEVGAAISKYYNVEVIYCFEKDGVLLDVEQDNSVIPEISTESFKDLIAKHTINNGMIPKIKNGLDAIKNGVQNCQIINSEALAAYVAGNVSGTKLIA